MTKANAICSCYWHRARKYLFRSCILLLSVMCTITHTHTAHIHSCRHRERRRHRRNKPELIGFCFWKIKCVAWFKKEVEPDLQHEVAIAQEVFEKFSKCICCAFILQSGDRQKQQEKQQRERKRIIKVCELQDYISFAIDLVSSKSALYRKIAGRYIYI